MSDAKASGQDPGTIFQLFGALQASAVLNAAVKLGVFGAIDRSAHEATAIARALECPPRSTRILLDALVAIGLVTKSGETYDATPLARDHLVPGKPMYVGDVANIFTSPMVWTEMARFDEVVRNDGTLRADHAETPGNPFWESFARSSAAMALPAAMALDGILGDHLASKPKAKVLDVAAGSGIFGATLAKRPNVETTLLDWPNVLAESEVWLQRLGVDRSHVKTIAGDFFQVNWEGPHDVILLCNVLHHFDDATCAGILKKASNALAPGGKVAVLEFLYDAEIRNPMGAMFATLMLAWTRHGQTYSAGDIDRWSKAAGFASTRVVPLQGMPASYVIADKA
jgi:2-polyprenyl-3-methyl-5-hydroxy-6-metoxy-1,4-benzoquinol methylase